VIVEDGRDVGRLYEDRNNRPELRWFWSITVYINPKLGITTSGRAASIEDAKAQFLTNWQNWRIKAERRRVQRRKERRAVPPPLRVRQVLLPNRCGTALIAYRRPGSQFAQTRDCRDQSR
jgi:hypothetical protein